MDLLVQGCHQIMITKTPFRNPYEVYAIRELTRYSFF